MDVFPVDENNTKLQDKNIKRKSCKYEIKMFRFPSFVGNLLLLEVPFTKAENIEWDFSGSVSKINFKYVKFWWVIKMKISSN